MKKLFHVFINFINKNFHIFTLNSISFCLHLLIIYLQQKLPSVKLTKFNHALYNKARYSIKKLKSIILSYKVEKLSHSFRKSLKVPVVDNTNIVYFGKYTYFLTDGAVRWKNLQVVA